MSGGSRGPPTRDWRSRGQRPRPRRHARQTLSESWELQGTGTGGIDPVVWDRKDARPLVSLFTNSATSMGRWSWSRRNDLEGAKPELGWVARTRSDTVRWQ